MGNDSPPRSLTPKISRQTEEALLEEIRKLRSIKDGEKSEYMC